MLDELTAFLAAEPALVLGGAVLALIILVLIGRKIHSTRAGQIADKLTGPVMFGGMIWSADAAWELTGPKYLNLGTPLRIAMFAVVEFMLLVAMLRAKDSMDDKGHPGRHGATAWLIASLIAAFGFILGLFEGGIVVAAFRPIIPLMLTKIWWDGILGDAPRPTGSFKWTPRKLLVLLGGYEPDDRDVKTVNRDQLTQKMTTLYYKSLYGPVHKRGTLRTKLARLTLDADDAIIRDVMHRVRRTAWTTAKPLPYEVTQTDDAPAGAGPTHPDGAAVAQPGAPRDAGVALPPTRRVKQATRPATSGGARDADPATQAAHLVLTQNLGIREAARKVPGAAEATVRRRIETITANTTDAAPGDAALTRPRINGHHPTLTEETP